MASPFRSFTSMRFSDLELLFSCQLILCFCEHIRTRIGLAEASPNNPLKCIHGCLEPGDRPPPAMVGLSNSPLDAAKLNRGITVVRPPPKLKDLKTTAGAICNLDMFPVALLGGSWVVSYKWG